MLKLVLGNTYVLGLEIISNESSVMATVHLSSISPEEIRYHVAYPRF